MITAGEMEHDAASARGHLLVCTLPTRGLSRPRLKHHYSPSVEKVFACELADRLMGDTPSPSTIVRIVALARLLPPPKDATRSRPRRHRSFE
jgi:hypothetical protein